VSTPALLAPLHVGAMGTAVIERAAAG